MTEPRAEPRAFPIKVVLLPNRKQDKAEAEPQPSYSNTLDPSLSSPGNLTLWSSSETMDPATILELTSRLPIVRPIWTDY